MFAGVTALGASACSAVSTGDPSELLGSVPTTSASAVDETDSGLTSTGLAIPGHGTLPTCSVDAGAVQPNTQVDVPAGAFMMGCNAAVDDECTDVEKPQHSVTLADFAIDKTEVTQAQYDLCVEAGKCQPPYCAWDPCAQPNLPITCVYREEAMDYCAFAGERLPTEAEWEKAARGTDGRKYPWGNAALGCNLANTGGCGGVRDVGSFPGGASPYGALDMVGNVVEWTLDVYDTTYYAQSPAVNPEGPPAAASSTFVGRGGGWASTEFWDRSGTRDWYQPTYVKDAMGFRCVK